MRQMTILSGKGGTGKTTVPASFAALSKNAVFADCDVDASNLHLLLQPKVLETIEFKGLRARVPRRSNTRKSRSHRKARSTGNQNSKENTYTRGKETQGKDKINFSIFSENLKMLDSVNSDTSQSEYI